MTAKFVKKALDFNKAITYICIRWLQNVQRFYCVQRPLCHLLNPLMRDVLRKCQETHTGMDVFETSGTVTNKTVGIFRYKDIRDLYYAFVKPLKTSAGFP